jgi:hypothetical protein
VPSPLHIPTDPTWAAGCHAIVEVREKVLRGTGFTMGVVRARVIFPYKVGHFFSSAGPLRADLVKFVFASRDFPRGPRPRRVLAAAPGRPPCGAVRCSAVCSRGATGRSAAIDVGRRDTHRRASPCIGDIHRGRGRAGGRQGGGTDYISLSRPPIENPSYIYIYLPLGSPSPFAPSDWPASLT